MTIYAETVLESVLVVVLGRLGPRLPQPVVANGDIIELIVRVPCRQPSLSSRKLRDGRLLTQVKSTHIGDRAERLLD